MPACLEAALLSPPYATYSYAVPGHFAGLAFPVGLRVAVPLSTGSRMAVVVGLRDAPPEGVALKPIIWPLERHPVLPPSLVRLAHTLSTRQAEPPGRILAGMLPMGLRGAAPRFEVEGEGRYALKTLAQADLETLARLAGEWEAGRMRPLSGAREEVALRLAVDPPWPLRPGAVRQAEVLDRLYAQGPTLKARLTRELGPWATGVVRELLRKKLLTTGEPPDEADLVAGEMACDLPPLEDLTPSPEQETALADLTAALDAAGEGGATRLLHGVTGSGKTLVYLRLATRCLASGRSALLLAPEVALACQMRRAAETVFAAEDIVFSHGYQSPRRREATFRELAGSDRPRVVVGTRSALFLPAPRPGLIVLDEEHDESFKQEERLPYQAKEVAWFRAREEGGLLVLGSATPDVKTFYAAETGQVPRLTLSRRVGESRLPTVELVDLREAEGGAAGTPLAPATLARLKETVASGEQAIIMLNRRGYAPVMYCPTCGEPAKCPACSVAYTYHKARERLVCHYCGRTEGYPLVCPGCGKAEHVALGDGTERLEETLAAELGPEVPLLRLDRDSARRQERLEEILRAFGRREAQVLVGTQMISKGHHFPDVTLVVAADADRGLNLPDYRASERTFQLLVQVSGRAGRGDKPGSVLIQTRNPEHPFWKYVLAADYEGFYRHELELRRKYRYPPFVKLGLLRLNWPVEEAGGAEVLGRVTAALRSSAKANGAFLMGPAPAPLSRLKGRKRYNCLLKAATWPAIRSVYAAARQEIPVGGAFRLSLDLDPVSML